MALLLVAERVATERRAARAASATVACAAVRVLLGVVIVGVWPFMWAETAVLFLLVLFPELVLTPMNWLR